jgi:hypothetical protein
MSFEGTCSWHLIPKPIVFLRDQAPALPLSAAEVMRGITVLRFVVPQTELTLDQWVLASTAIFSPTGCEMSAAKSFHSPDMPIADVIGSSGVGEVGMNA